MYLYFTFFSWPVGQEQPQSVELKPICAVLLGRCRMCPLGVPACSPLCWIISAFVPQNEIEKEI